MKAHDCITCAWMRRGQSAFECDNKSECVDQALWTRSRKDPVRQYTAKQVLARIIKMTNEMIANGFGPMYVAAAIALKEELLQIRREMRRRK